MHTMITDQPSCRVNDRYQADTLAHGDGDGDDDDNDQITLINLR